MSPYVKRSYSASLALAATLFVAGCSSSFTSTPVASPPVVYDGVKGQIQKLEESFVSGGLNAAEATALAEAMIIGGGGTLAANETLVGYAQAPDMVEAGMQTLGTTAFTSDTRKRLAIPVFMTAVFTLFSADLTALTDADLITFAGNILAAQIGASSAPNFNAENHRNSFRALLSSAVNNSAAYVETEEARLSLWKAIASKSVPELLALNLFASNMKSLLGNLAGGVFEATSGIAGLTAGEKSELMIEFTARLYATIESTGLSTADLIEASANVDTEITAILAADADLLAAPVLGAQVTKSSKEGGACLATAKWVYMFEYNDSRCQTVSKKWVQGPTGGSPLNRGFPNHAFCYRNDVNGLYYNWLASAAGCASALPVSPAVFPNNPSPQNLTTTPAGGFACQYGSAGAETGTNGESQEKCEGRGLAQFIAGSSDDYTEVWVSGTLVATFDVANGGITFPSIARACTVTTSPAGLIRQTTYVRTTAECTEWCERVIYEDNATAYDCKLAGTLVHTYAGGTVTVAPVPNSLTNTVALTTVPAAFTKSICTPIGFTLQRTSDSVAQSGLSQAVNFEGSAYFINATTAYRLSIYADSACTRAATVARLPSGETEGTVYVSVPTTAVTVDLHTTPEFLGAAGAEALAIPVTP